MTRRLHGGPGAVSALGRRRGSTADGEGNWQKIVSPRARSRVSRVLAPEKCGPRRLSRRWRASASPQQQGHSGAAPPRRGKQACALARAERRSSGSGRSWRGSSPLPAGGSLHGAQGPSRYGVGQNDDLVAPRLTRHGATNGGRCRLRRIFPTGDRRVPGHRLQVAGSSSASALGEGEAPGDGGRRPIHLWLPQPKVPRSWRGSKA